MRKGLETTNAEGKEKQKGFPFTCSLLETNAVERNASLISSLSSSSSSTASASDLASPISAAFKAKISRTEFTWAKSTKPPLCSSPETCATTLLPIVFSPFCHEAPLAGFRPAMTACGRCEEDEEAMILIHHQLFRKTKTPLASAMKRTKLSPRGLCNNTRGAGSARNTARVHERNVRSQDEGRDCDEKEYGYVQKKYTHFCTVERTEIASFIFFSFSFSFKRKFKSNLLKG
jgi:hypothetical protein